MPTVRRILLHSRGPALWPEHKSLPSILADRETTEEDIWQTTFQLNATSPGGAAFKSEWWGDGRNRFELSPRWIERNTIRRFISFDTAYEKGETNAWTAGGAFDLTRTWDVALTDCERRRVGFDELPDFIESFTARNSQDGKTAGLLIERKASGISAIQTIKASSKRWLARLIIDDFSIPNVSKEERYRLAARWAKLGFLKLPFPGDHVPWLFDYSKELFDAPKGRFLDQADMTAQIVLALQRYFEIALRARERAHSLPR